MPDLEPIARTFQNAIPPRSRQDGDNLETPSGSGGIRLEKMTCPICKGAHYVHPVYPSGQTNWRQTVPCPCWWGDHTPYGVRPGKTFDNFRQIAGMEESLRYARIFAAGGVKFLLIYGGIGNGKTHLCEAVAVAMQTRGLAVSVRRCPELLLHFTTAMKAENLEPEVHQIERLTVLILDEFQGDWPSGVLATIINYRYSESLPTMMTTNLDHDQIPGRILSRFNERPLGRVCLNFAPDFRI